MTLVAKSKPDYGAGLSAKIKQPPEPSRALQHGDLSQVARGTGMGSYFLSGAVGVNVVQLVGTPLYYMNKDWYNSWIAFTKQSFGLLTMTMTQFWAPTVVRVSGDKSVRGQILQTVDGNLLCDFPEKMVLMANHQIYTDWLYLWWIGYTAGMHGRIYIVLKESLKLIPVVGWGMQLSQFIFLKRNWEKDKPQLAKHLQTLNKPGDPMWLMMFPEGTNLADSTRESSRKWAEKNGINDMQHQLLPRSRGLLFCIQQLRKTVDYVYDCTIAYEGVPRGQYAQDIYTVRASYLGGRPPKSVNMYWRRFAISAIPLNDPKLFDTWLRARWIEKDRLIEYYYRNGQFPADDGVDKGRDGQTRRGCGHIVTEIKAFHWYDFLQVFAPIGVFAMVLYTFYSALPKAFLSLLDRQGLLAKIKAAQNMVMGSSQKLLMDTVKTAAVKKIGTQPTQKLLQNGTITQKKITANVPDNPKTAVSIAQKTAAGKIVSQSTPKSSPSGLASQQVKVTVPTTPKSTLKQAVNPAAAPLIETTKKTRVSAKPTNKSQMNGHVKTAQHKKPPPSVISSTSSKPQPAKVAAKPNAGSTSNGIVTSTSKKPELNKSNVAKPTTTHITPSRPVPTKRVQADSDTASTTETISTNWTTATSSAANKPFKCPHRGCGKVFAVKGNMKRHETEVHKK